MNRTEFEIRYGDILKARDWDYNLYDDTVELQWYSPAGEDFWAGSFSIDNLADELYDFYQGFDAEQHVMSVYGMAGAPGLRELIDDAEQIDSELRYLSWAVYKCDSRAEFQEEANECVLDDNQDDGKGR